MSLYVLAYPTVLLFVNITSFSQSSIICKYIAEALATKKLNPKKIVESGIKQTLIISIIFSIFFYFTIPYISVNLLKNATLIFPLKCALPLLILVGISDNLRGYFSGCKDFYTASMSKVIEQVTRTTCSIIGIYAFINQSLILSASMLFIALSLGEIASIVYCLIKLKKSPIPSYKTNNTENKIIFKMSSINTLSRLIGSFTYFLEPVLYTLLLSKKGYELNHIHQFYTLIDSFVIPVLTIGAFIPFSLCSLTLPHISEAYALKNNDRLHHLLRKTFIYTLLTSCFITIIIFFYNQELMVLLYKTHTGCNYVKASIFFFLAYYVNTLCSSVLTSIGEYKLHFNISSCLNLLRVLLIIIFCLSKSFSLYSVIISTIISLIIGACINFYYMVKKTSFKPSLSDIQIILCTILITTSVGFINSFFNLSILLNIFIIFIIYITIYFKFFHKS